MDGGEVFYALNAVRVDAFVETFSVLNKCCGQCRYYRIGITSSPLALMMLCIAAIAVTNSSKLFILFFHFLYAETCCEEIDGIDLLDKRVPMESKEVRCSRRSPRLDCRYRLGRGRCLCHGHQHSAAKADR